MVTILEHFENFDREVNIEHKQKYLADIQHIKSFFIQLCR